MSVDANFSELVQFAWDNFSDSALEYTEATASNGAELGVILSILAILLLVLVCVVFFVFLPKFAWNRQKK